TYKERYVRNPFPIQPTQQVACVLHQVRARGNNFPENASALSASDRMVFVDRNQLAVDCKTAKVVDLSHRTFLEKRIVAILAMIVDIAAQLLFRMRVKYREIELGSV